MQQYSPNLWAKETVCKIGGAPLLNISLPPANWHRIRKNCCIAYKFHDFSLLVLEITTHIQRQRHVAANNVITVNVIDSHYINSNCYIIGCFTP